MWEWVTDMLYYLLYHVLQKFFSPLNVFRYITVRTVYASLTAMFLALVFGPWLIRMLRELQIGQYIREEGPKAHRKKAGKPANGGDKEPSLVSLELRGCYLTHDSSLPQVPGCGFDLLYSISRVTVWQ